ncbi:MAG: paraquat-inducible protein A, partial [Pseudomonadales bacterium]
ACHECGHIYDSPLCAEGQRLSCKYCGGQLQARYKNWEAKTAAFTLAGVVLFVLSNSFPFIGLDVAGQIQSSNLLSGVRALITREEFLLAALVFVTIFLFPLVELCALCYILLLRVVAIKPVGMAKVLRLLHMTRPWSMLEIFMLGVLVASVKLVGMAELVIGPGLYAFTGLVLVLIASHIRLSRQDLWDWLEHDNYYASDEQEKMFACHCCNALIGESLLAQNHHCPRCDGVLHERMPASVQKTFALLTAAIILYFPANLLPMMTTTHLGSTTTDTIFSGVVHLAEIGDWGVATVVFVASIVVPIAKILIMAYLLWVVQIKASGDPKQQAQLFRVTEFVGRWSMIDVFVVTLLVALVQFGLLANIEPGAAALCFASVVVLTMLAAETFDPKLIWDAHHER